MGALAPDQTGPDRTPVPPHACSRGRRTRRGRAPHAVPRRPGGWRAGPSSGNRGTARGARRGGQSDDAGADDEHLVAVVRASPASGRGTRWTRARRGSPPGRARCRAAVEHGVVRQHRLGPATTEVLGKAQRSSGAENPAVEVEARRRPAPGTVDAQRLDTPRQAGDARVDHHTSPGGDRHLGPASTTMPRRLVPEDEGNVADRCKRRRGPRVVGEEVEVAPADATGQQPPLRAHDGPGSCGLGQVGQRRREFGVQPCRTARHAPRRA